MAEQIHGHAVLEMVADAGHSYSLESLRAAIDERFGPDARFYTCSAQDLTAEQLIGFLYSRGKFRLVDDCFTTDRSVLCDH